MSQYSLQPALIVLVGYVLINGSVENFVKPKRMGDSFNLSPVVVFVSLFVWGYLLGGSGAILAVPLTMLVVLGMENFEGTRTLAVLMPYTGEAKDEEKQVAMKQVNDLWEKARKSISSDRGPNDDAD